jgi:hypothetical protein
MFPVGGLSCPRLTKCVVTILYEMTHDVSFRRNVVTGCSEMLKSFGYQWNKSYFAMKQNVARLRVVFSCTGVLSKLEYEIMVGTP